MVIKETFVMNVSFELQKIVMQFVILHGFYRQRTSLVLELRALYRYNVINTNIQEERHSEKQN